MKTTFAPRFYKCPACRQSALRWRMTYMAASAPQEVRCTACGWSGTKGEVVKATKVAA